MFAESKALSNAESLAQLLGVAEKPKFTEHDETYGLPEGYAFPCNDSVEVRVAHNDTVVLSKVTDRTLQQCRREYQKLYSALQGLNPKDRIACLLKMLE